MTTQEQNIAVAELRGWKWARLAGTGNPFWLMGPDNSRHYLPEVFVSRPDSEQVQIYGGKDSLPNYCLSLDACAEFERDAPDGYWIAVYSIVNRGTVYSNSFCKRGWINVCKSTPPQRVEAFLRMHGKWREA